jgi:hypothetical protein
MRIKKAQTGAGVPKGYVKGEMTGKLYKKSEMDKRKKDFASELNKASIFGKKDSIKPVPKKKMKDGGKSFPDLNKDGKVTKADILVGRGVIKAKRGVKAQAGVSLRTSQLKRLGRLTAKNEDKAKEVGSKMVERSTRRQRGKEFIKKNLSELMPKSKSGSKMGKCRYGCK